VPERLGAAVLEAHPCPTLVLGADLVVLHANAAARQVLGARAGAKLGDALSCIEARAPGGCGSGSRCGGCAFQRCVRDALAGKAGRARGFVLRGGEAGKAPDLHLIGSAVPFGAGASRRAILALDDANAILADPGIVHVCEGCGRVQDEEGQWHPLHRYLADRLGLEAGGPLCDACEGRARR
jgi:hypothetical protein